VQQVGTPLDLYDRPANLFVAGFIGSPAMNMLGGTYRAADTAFVAHDNSVVPLGRAYACVDGAPVTLGIRPEHVVVGGGGHVTAPVELVEPTGFGTILHLRALGTDLKAFTLERKTAQVGETTSVTVPPDRLHLFDASGERIA
jgi:multiple sugar transport system ATP-binding protein